MGVEQRQSPRVSCYAKVLYARKTPGYIRDLSLTGCHISFVQQIPATAGDIIEVEVVAGGGAQISPFRVHLVIRWAKSDGIYFSIGGDVAGAASPEEQQSFTKLVQYYETQY